MQRILFIFISTLVLFHSISVGWSVAGEEAVTVSSAELKQLKAQIEALQKKFQELSEKQVTADERVAITQEEQEQQDVSKEEVEKYKGVKKAAKKEKVEKAAKQDATGTDPRVFSDKWMPYYRYTKLEMG